MTRTGDQDRWLEFLEESREFLKNRAFFLKNRAFFLRNRASFLRTRASFSGILQVFWGIEKGLLNYFTCIQRSIYTLWSTYNQWSMKIRLPVTPVTASFIFCFFFVEYHNWVVLSLDIGHFPKLEPMINTIFGTKWKTTFSNIRRKIGEKSNKIRRKIGEKPNKTE